MTVASKVWKGTSNADTHTMLAGTENVLFGFGGADALTASDTLLTCLLYTSPSPRDRQKSRMPSSA